MQTVSPILLSPNLLIFLLWNNFLFPLSVKQGFLWFPFCLWPVLKSPPWPCSIFAVLCHILIPFNVLLSPTLWNSLLFPFYYFFLSVKKNNTLLPLTWLTALTNDPRPSLPCWDHGTVYLQLAGAPHRSGYIPLSLSGGAPASTSAHHPAESTHQLLSTAHFSSLGFALLHTYVMTKWCWKGLWQVN